MIARPAGARRIASQGASRRHAAQRARAGALRLGTEQDGRATVARCRRGYLPSPLDMPPVEGVDPKKKDKKLIRKPKPDEPFCGLVFKIVAGHATATFFYVRVYSGRLKANSRIPSTPAKDKKENVPQLWRIQADERQAGRRRRGGRHHRRHWPAEFGHRRHALRRPRSNLAGIDPVPRDGRFHGDRAGKLDGAKEARRRPRA